MFQKLDNNEGNWYLDNLSHMTIISTIVSLDLCNYLGQKADAILLISFLE